MKLLPTWFPRRVSGGILDLILTRQTQILTEVRQMADELQAVADQLKTDMATITTGVQTTLQRIADLTAQLASATPPDNAAVIAELTDIHTQAQGVIATLPSAPTSPTA